MGDTRTGVTLPLPRRTPLGAIRMLLSLKYAAVATDFRT
jgi:hypothetical protein